VNQQQLFAGGSQASARTTALHHLFSCLSSRKLITSLLLTSNSLQQKSDQIFLATASTLADSLHSRSQEGHEFLKQFSLPSHRKHSKTQNG
jgi:hypothetical protein